MSAALDEILAGWSFRSLPERLRITRTYDTTGAEYDVYLEDNGDPVEWTALMTDSQSGHLMIGLNVDDEGFDRVLYNLAPGEDVVDTLRTAMEALAVVLRAAERVTKSEDVA